MKKCVRRFSVVFDRTLDRTAFFSGFLLMFMVFLVVVDVTMRGLFNHPIFFGEMPTMELVCYLLVWMPFVCTAWVLKKGAHVRMDLVLSHLNPSTKSLQNAITSILATIVCLIYTYYGVMVTWKNFQFGVFIGSSAEPPKWPLIMIIPISMFLLSLQFIRESYRHIKEFRGSVSR